MQKRSKLLYGETAHIPSGQRPLSSMRPLTQEESCNSLEQICGCLHVKRNIKRCSPNTLLKVNGGMWSLRILYLTER